MVNRVNNVVLSFEKQLQKSCIIVVIFGSSGSILKEKGEKNKVRFTYWKLDKKKVAKLQNQSPI